MRNLYRLQLISPERDCKSPRGSNFSRVPRGGSNFFKRFTRGGQIFLRANFFDFLRKIKEKSIFLAGKLQRIMGFSEGKICSAVTPLVGLFERCEF